MVTVWGKQDCFLCNRMKERLLSAGINFEFKELQPILDGKCDMNNSDTVRLVEKYFESGFRMPIVESDGVFMSYPEAAKWISELNSVQKGDS